MKRTFACLLVAVLLGVPLGAQGFLKGKILYFDAGNRLSEQTGSSFQFSLLGAEAQYSFAPRVRLDITRKDFREFTESKGARIRAFGYDFLAAVSFGHFGVYGKFQPASARRFPDPGPAFSTWTVGVCLTTF